MRKFVCARARTAAATALASAFLHASRSEYHSSKGSAAQLLSRRVSPAVSFTHTAVTTRRFQSSSSTASSESSGTAGEGSHSHSGHGDAKDYGPTEAEQCVIDEAKPNSTVMEERLGFVAGETIDEEGLKEHFFILAKHYHPDNPSAPPNSAEAFTNIKDAYDVLLKDVKGGRTRTSHGHGGYAGGFGSEAQYADEAQRRARMRALGDGVMFFILVTLAYILAIATHNRERMKSRYLLHFFGIFFIVQLFPRLLAATVLFAVHTTYLIQNGELHEQAAMTLLVNQRPKDLSVRLEGIHPGCREHTVVQVEIVVEPPQTPATEAKKDPSATATDTAPAPVALLVSSATTTLTLDPGVTSFTLPLPPKGEEKRTTYKVKAVDEKRKFVLVEKQFKLLP